MKGKGGRGESSNLFPIKTTNNVQGKEFCDGT